MTIKINSASKDKSNISGLSNSSEQLMPGVEASQEYNRSFLPGQRNLTRMTPDKIIGLQRTIGNQAVNRLIQRQKNNFPANPAPKNAGPVQTTAQRLSPETATGAVASLPDEVSSPVFASDDSHATESDTQSFADFSSIKTNLEMDTDLDGEKEQHTLTMEPVNGEIKVIMHSEPELFEKYLEKKKVPKNILHAVLELQSGVNKKRKKPLTHTRAAKVNARLAQISQLLLNYDVKFRPQSVIKWSTTQIKSPKTGIAETVTSKLLAEPLTYVPDPNNNPGKSVDNSATPFMQEIRKYAQYKRGHMLNSKVHGPGEDKNLVPISTQFNKDMERGVEEVLKLQVNSRAKVVSYSVVVSGWGNYAGSGSRNSAENQLPTTFEFIIEQMKLKGPKFDPAKPDSYEKNGNKFYNKTLPHPIPNDTKFNLSDGPNAFLPEGAYEINSFKDAYPSPNNNNEWILEGSALNLAKDMASTTLNSTVTFKPPQIIVGPGGKSGSISQLPINQIGDYLIVGDGKRVFFFRKQYMDNHEKIVKNRENKLNETVSNNMALLEKYSNRLDEVSRETRNLMRDSQEDQGLQKSLALFKKKWIDSTNDFLSRPMTELETMFMETLNRSEVQEARISDWNEAEQARETGYNTASFWVASEISKRKKDWKAQLSLISSQAKVLNVVQPKLDKLVKTDIDVLEGRFKFLEKEFLYQKQDFDRIMNAKGKRKRDEDQDDISNKDLKHTQDQHPKNNYSDDPNADDPTIINQ